MELEKGFRPLIGVIISKLARASVVAEPVTVVSVPLSGLLFLNYALNACLAGHDMFPSPYRGYYF